MHRCRPGGFARCVCLAVLFSLRVVPAWADDPAPPGNVPKDVRQGPWLEETPVETVETGENVLTGTLHWLEEFRDARSREVGEVGRYIDAFLAGDDVEDVPNKSYIRLSAQSTVSEVAGRGGEDYSIRAKLDLPNSQRRWKLFFESDDTGANRLEQKVRNVTGDDTESVGGLRLESDRAHDWLIDTDVGIRAKLPLDPFIRLKVRRDWHLDTPWTLSFEHEDWYYDSKGFGTEASFDFHRPMTENYYLSIVTAAQFQDRYDVLELAQSVTTTHLIDDRNAISYGAGVLGVNKPSVKATAYYVSANYQRRLHRDWLFMDVRPELLFPRTENFRPQWSLTVEFKALLIDN